MNSGLGKRILWIEDDYSRLRNLVLPLKSKGFEVVSATSVVEAREILSMGQSYQVILLDMIIPYDDRVPVALDPSLSDVRVDTAEDLVRNGLLLLDHIKRVVGDHVPVVVLSVVQSAGVRQELANRGVYEILSKGSLLPQKLCDVVLRAISHGGPDQSCLPEE